MRRDALIRDQAKHLLATLLENTEAFAYKPFQKPRVPPILTLMKMTELADEQWKRLEPLLPPRRPRGRPRADDRKTLTASFTCCVPDVAGRTCLMNTAPLPPAGGGLERGKRTAPGRRSGATCWPSWTGSKRSSGLKRSWTAASCRSKGGSSGRQDQTRQGHQGDAGRRRRRLAHWFSPRKR